jgi:glycosyltransferase involved in cell wall biosynthesis
MGKLKLYSIDMRASTSFDKNRLLIIQPYIPAYRQPLFAALKNNLADNGLQLAVASAQAHGEDHLRGDDTSALAADFLLDERRVRFGQKSLIYRQLAPAIESFRPGFIIVEQAIKNVESWPILLRESGRKRPSVAMWGQGRSYSTTQSALEAHAKAWLTRRTDWFFAYTQAGADHVVSNGYPRRRTTVLLNSTDSRALRSQIAGLTVVEVEAYRALHGLTAGRTALFLGGVDSRKGIPFLLAAAKETARRLPGFTLLIGGSGDLAAEVIREQETGGPIRYLGRIEGRSKALALAATDVLMIPEWVGLVAVDSLAAGRPIITTRHRSHSPEVEYLQDNKTAVFTEYNIESYASEVVALLHDRLKLEAMQIECFEAANSFSIEGMAQNFTSGICAWRELSAGTY